MKEQDGANIFIDFDFDLDQFEEELEEKTTQPVEKELVPKEEEQIRRNVENSQIENKAFLIALSSDEEEEGEELE